MSYAIGFFLTLPLTVVLIFTEAPILWLILLPAILLLICSPLIFKFSRAIWLYLDRNLDRHQ